jgi:hypothetical protein
MFSFPFLSRRGLALLASALLIAGCAKSTGDAPPVAAPSPVPAAAPAGAPAEVQRMMGNWLRSDGTYRLDLRAAEADGVVRAGYFNPKSINVSRSVWMRGPEGLRVIVELNDVGYPGSTYVLSYEASADRLVGIYNQAGTGQSFEVDFVRMKGP